MDRKYREALDLALLIVANHDDETDVTEDDVRTWSEYDLYEWLEAWDYEWCVGGWEYIGFDE